MSTLHTLAQWFKAHIVFVLLLMSSVHLMAQNEGNIWYFGNGAGLDFNSGGPVALTDGVMFTSEGCATISDTDGKLLFYTDGITVWNQNHFPMPNGNNLSGNPSSSQSAVVVQIPNSEFIYLVFTVDEEVGPMGLRYSELDIRLDGGLGDITASKDILIATPTSEKIAAIQHANKVDYWIVTQIYGTNTFHSYLLTASGLSLTPVISSVGSVITGNTFYSIGYLKASLDGIRLASAYWRFDEVSLFDFDNANGILSNEIRLDGFIEGSPYGVEFSPDGTLLYVSTGGSFLDYVEQFDLNAGNATDIVNSRVLIGNATLSGALQLGPDQKIYHATFGEAFLNVIDFPNQLGIGCNFRSQTVSLNGRFSSFGLPTFYNNITLRADFNSINHCYGDSTCFRSIQRNVDSVFWNFGDSSSLSLNTSFDFDPKHVFSDTGLFNVTLIAFLDSISDTSSVDINIFATPNVDLGVDTFLCLGDHLELIAGENIDDQYLWQDFSTDSIFNVIQGGTYSVDVLNTAGCKMSDTIHVVYGAGPTISLISNTLLCQGDSFQLSTGNSQDQHLWSTGNIDSIITISTTDQYWVEVTDTFGCSISDTVDIVFSAIPLIDLGTDVIACEDDTVELGFPPDALTYLWSTTEMTSSISITMTDQYWLKISDALGCENKDTLNVLFNPEPILDLGNDTLLCEGDTLYLSSSTEAQSYQWSTGGTESAINIISPADYWLEIHDDKGCNALDTIQVTYTALPNVDLGADSIVCEGARIELNAESGGNSYLWSTDEITQRISIEDPGVYWVEFTDEFNCISRDSIEIYFESIPTVSLGADTTVCIHDEYNLEANKEGLVTTYLWQDNSVNSSYTVRQPGAYWLQVKNLCGQATDSTLVDFINCDCRVYLPNAFSPNDDGINDVYQPFSDCEFITFHLQLFDRWGAKVFDSIDPFRSWDGTIDGKLAQLGVYASLLSYKFPQQELKTMIGSITIIR